MAETITAIKECHQGEWVAVLVTREEQGVPVEGEVLAQAKSRWDIHMAVKGRPEDIYVFFAGPSMKQGCYLLTRVLFGFLVPSRNC